MLQSFVYGELRFASIIIFFGLHPLYMFCEPFLSFEKFCGLSEVIPQKYLSVDKRKLCMGTNSNIRSY